MVATGGTLTYQWAFKIIHYFSLLGISNAVISPGSRSTPLALACEKHPKINTWIDIDERSAGFFALGLAQSSQRPVLLICTSGTAVANWFPAVVEANYSYTPLILLSADRPDELHNCGANQTIEQQHLFGSHVREFIQLEHPAQQLLGSNYLQETITRAGLVSRYNQPGPVHINIPLREPLLPQATISENLNKMIDQLSQKILVSSNPETDHKTGHKIELNPVSPDITAKLLKLMAHPQGLIICGRLSAREQAGLFPVLKQLAERLKCPVLIDPLSGLRLRVQNSQNFIINYDSFINKTEFDNLSPQWIMHFGQFPLSKKLHQYLQVQKSQRIIISSYGDCLDPLHTRKEIIHSLPTDFCKSLLPLLKPAPDDHWLSLWQSAEQEAQDRIDYVIKHTELFEAHIIDTLLRYIPEQSIIFSGNSMAIRDFDTFINHHNNTGKALKLYANRGASGIDGNISTFAGLLAAGSDAYAVAVLGDLSFFHDMNGLHMLKQLQKKGCKGTIIVINNHGGGIFNYLPASQLDDFEKLWQTDTDLEFKHCAHLYKLNYLQIKHLSELNHLAESFRQTGFTLVEVIINPQTSVKYHQQI